MTACRAPSSGGQEQRATCGWCRGVVVSYVGPPQLTRFTMDVPALHVQQAWVVCSQCHVALLGLIDSRRASREPRAAKLNLMRQQRKLAELWEVDE